MIDFYNDTSGYPINVRSLTKKLNGFQVTQGATSDGRNIYMVFERRHHNGCARRCRIVKLDAGTLELKQVSDVLRIGHGNDMAYRDGVLYITHSFGNRRIHRVNARTLKQMEGIEVSIPQKFRRKRIRCFNGIACFGNGYILRVMGGTGMLVVDENFQGIRYFRTSNKYKTSQGMAQKNRTTYRAYSELQSSDKNFLVTFDDDGKMISKERLELTGEMESVFFVGEQLCGTVYRRTADKAGRKRYAAYVYRIYGY